MPTEFEAKVLEVEPEEVAARVLRCGGERVGVALMRRFVYDVVAGDAGRWVRLRDDGRRVTLTVKEIRHDGIDGTDETEVVVGDFGTAHELLGKLGFEAKSYQENRRTSFVLDGAAVEIDEWPMIPPYLEIEADSRARVVEVAAMLGFDESRLTGENTVKVYARYGIDLAAHREVRLVGGVDPVEGALDG